MEDMGIKEITISFGRIQFLVLSTVVQTPLWWRLLYSLLVDPWRILYSFEGVKPRSINQWLNSLVSWRDGFYSIFQP